MEFDRSRRFNLLKLHDGSRRYQAGRFRVRPTAALAALAGFEIFLAGALLEGSPVAASSTSPPPARAISARSRPLTADFGCVTVISFDDAYLSRCLINSHDGLLLPPNPWVRTSTQDPFNFLPCRVNLKSPLSSAAAGSGCSGFHLPVSQTITVPPPYSPAGITPSNFAYSTG